ncbi:hypothetical protein PWO93_07615 [Lactiplantibacillus paraplantarum]|nr:hypothetical protein [Lactiplantibacillus paraplantarum]WEE34600.1 hypothetical protein PWO93_07615 [Lactiplantibacillus paraplantarum]
MKWYYKIFQTIILTVAAGLLGWMIMANWQISLQLHLSINAWMGAILFVLFIGITIGFGSWWLSRHQTSWLVATLFGLTLLKFPLVIGLKINPTSDFWNYHTLAVFSAQGLTWTQLLHRGTIGNYVVFPHALNIANGYSLAAAFGGSNFFVSQLINIGCTLVDMVLIYWLVARWLSRQLGIMTALIFYWIPAYWLYGSLLNGGEPFFLTSVLLMMYALTRALVPLPTTTLTDRHLYLALAIVATIVANMLRPIMAVWLIALSLMAIILLFTVGRHYRYQYRQLMIYGGVVLGLLFTATNIDSWLYGFKVAPSRAETLYSLATGTDVKSRGTYSPTLQTTVSHELRAAPTLTQAYPRITRTMTTALQTNLKQVQLQMGTFANQKMQGFIREDYGYDWSLYNLSNHSGLLNHSWFHLAPILITSATVYWQIMLIIALLSILIGLGLQWRQHYLNRYLLMGALLLDGFTLSALPLEVQGRYHIILYLPVLMLMTCGIAAMKLWWHNRQIKHN